jgi:hypothetical protein
MSQATNGNTTNLSRRTALAGLAAAVPAGITPAIASQPKDDPIFAAIAAYRAAVKAYLAAFEIDDESAEDIIQETGSAHVDALEELLTCRPTTLPGVVALLDLLAEPDHGHDPEDAILAGAIGWDGEIKAAAMKLPAVLAETMRALIGEQS